MSSHAKNNIMTMAELLRAAKEKRAREEEKAVESPDYPDDSPLSITANGIPANTIPPATIPRRTIPKSTIVKRSIPRRVTPSSTRGIEVDSSRGYFKYLNDLSDRIIPELKLKPYEQVVLNRLYRLSRGWKSEECSVGLGTLAKQCVMSRTSVQKAIGVLIEKGLVEDLGEDKKGGREGKRYRVLPTLSIPNSTIVPGGIPGDDASIPPGTTEVRGTIPPDTTIKDSNKEFKDTHTHIQNFVGVGGSNFTIEECRKYAQHLQSTGQGINNPGV